VIDADFDHNGVQSGDIKVINGSKITTLASMVDTDTISLTGVMGATVDIINNNSILLIGGHKVGDSWFYFRDQVDHGQASTGDLFNDTAPNPPGAPVFPGFNLTAITELPTGIANWDIPGWAALNNPDTPVDERNVWVDGVRVNVIPNVLASGVGAYHFYQVI
jgi:hypothetical protein